MAGQSMQGLSPAMKDKYVRLGAKGRRKTKGLLARMSAERKAA